MLAPANAQMGSQRMYGWNQADQRFDPTVFRSRLAPDPPANTSDPTACVLVEGMHSPQPLAPCRRLPPGPRPPPAPSGSAPAPASRCPLHRPLPPHRRPFGSRRPGPSLPAREWPLGPSLSPVDRWLWGSFAPLRYTSSQPKQMTPAWRQETMTSLFCSPCELHVKIQVSWR